MKIDFPCVSCLGLLYYPFSVRNHDIWAIIVTENKRPQTIWRESDLAFWTRLSTQTLGGTPNSRTYCRQHFDLCGAGASVGKVVAIQHRHWLQIYSPMVLLRTDLVFWKCVAKLLNKNITYIYYNRFRNSVYSPVQSCTVPWYGQSKSSESVNTLCHHELQHMLDLYSKQINTDLWKSDYWYWSLFWSIMGIAWHWDQ